MLGKDDRDLLRCARDQIGHLPDVTLRSGLIAES
jgi:hypothetical protein